MHSLTSPRAAARDLDHHRHDPSRPRPAGRRLRRARRPARLAAALLFTVALASAAHAQTTAATAAAETIVVTAGRTPQPLSSVLADVSVLDRTAIERSGAVGVAELLARLPGIEFARNGGPGTATTVFIRGSETRHAALYIDGMRVDAQGTGGALWEQVPLEQIERIEVLRGPAAAVYGSDAVGGVVQLFTRRGSGPPRATASAGVGSHDTARVQAGLSGSADAFDYSLSASHGRSEGFSARTPAVANPDDDGWRRSAAQARAGWQLTPAHRVDASLLASRLRAQVDVFDPVADELAFHSLHTASLAWQGRWSADTTSRLQAGRTKSTYESQPFFFRTETTLTDATLQHEQRLGGHVLTGTLERREDELLNPATAFDPELAGRRRQHGVAFGWRTDLGDHGVQLHARHDDDSEFGGHATGSVAWGWRFLPQWRVSASAATSFRVPTLYQRFSAFGNPALVPETGRNVELALRWAASESLDLALTAWRNTVSRLINFGPPGPCADPFGCYENVGRARLQGATLSGRAPLGGFALRGSFDWHDPRNLDTDTVLARRARRLATFGADGQWAGFALGAEVQAAGARFEDAANRQRMGGYALLNLSVGRALMPGLVLEGRIDNALDKAYELTQTFQTAGRTAQLTLRWVQP
ncbi:MAG: TonB-dependent receptor [Rubrivivax sp.]|nr:TonB-dependent receptor [Rubrivivax sp.]